MSKELCFFCNNELSTIKDVHKEQSGNKTIIIKNTPIIYCENCNEKYISADVSDNIEKIMNIALSYKINDDIIIVDYKEMMNTLNEISVAG